MGVVVAFLVGYVLGARAGREGLEELLDSLQTISQSNEFRGVLGTGLALVDSTVRGMLAPQRAATGNGRDESAFGGWARETLSATTGGRLS
jgi:hypothetical protein